MTRGSKDGRRRYREIPTTNPGVPDHVFDRLVADMMRAARALARVAGREHVHDVMGDLIREMPLGLEIAPQRGPLMRSIWRRAAMPRPVDGPSGEPPLRA